MRTIYGSVEEWLSNDTDNWLRVVCDPNGACYEWAEGDER